MRRAGLLILACLIGCDARPRPASYFEAHPQALDRALAACRRGALRGAECEAAQRADAERAIQARLTLFRRGFA